MTLVEVEYGYMVLYIGSNLMNVLRYLYGHAMFFLIGFEKCDYTLNLLEHF